MVKVIRKYIPLAVRVAVAERQFTAATSCECTDDFGVPLRLSGASLRKRLDAALHHLSAFGTKKLELHHRPALENRPLNRAKTDHVPPANDPEHLVYLLKDEEHKIETYVRGVNGQLSDVSLRRKNRRREKKLAPKLVTGLQLRGRLAQLAGSRPIQNANRWPPKGSRKLRSRR